MPTRVVPMISVAMRWVIGLMIVIFFGVLAHDAFELRAASSDHVRITTPAPNCIGALGHHLVWEHQAWMCVSGKLRAGTSVVDGDLTIAGHACVITARDSGPLISWYDDDDVTRIHSTSRVTIDHICYAVADPYDHITATPMNVTPFRVSEGSGVNITNIDGTTLNIEQTESAIYRNGMWSRPGWMAPPL